MHNSLKGKKTIVLDKFLILLAIICITFAVLIIGMYLSNAEIFANTANEMKENYTSTESNTWDVSENGDGSVIATLDENGLLTISGQGNVKDWNGSAGMPWFNKKSNIKEIKIEEGVTSIGNFSFMNCIRLTNIEISSTVSDIGTDIFLGSDNIINIKVDENNESYCDVNGVLYTKDKTILMIYPGKKQDTVYTILDGVTTIKSNAFRYCISLTSIEIPEGVIDIGSSAFNGCSSLKEIQIPSSVTSIGIYAFSGCHSLKNIEVNETNTNYMDDNGVLYTKDKTEIIKYPEGKQNETYTILDGTTSIKLYAFEDCNILKEIKIPSGLTSIGSKAFYRCSALTEIEIPDAVTSIKSYAFSYCSNLRTIKVNENNQNYYDDNGVLYTKDKTEIIKYPEGKQEETYTILSETTSIDRYAFSRCSNLKEVTILEGINNIKERAFEESKNLIIICKNNTVVQDYAEDNNIKYISTNYDLQKQYIKVTKVGITYEQFINDIETNMEYSLKQENEIVENTTTMKTGQTLKIGDNSYTIIITGDTTGDGQADIKDILAINKHRLNKASLTAEYLQASDVNEDGKTDIKDILQINKFRLGKIENL